MGGVLRFVLERGCLCTVTRYGNGSYHPPLHAEMRRGSKLRYVILRPEPAVKAFCYRMRRKMTEDDDSIVSKIT